MTTIREITKKLFGVSYEKDFDDEKITDFYQNAAIELIKNNKWPDVYASWFDYLINDCKTEEEVLNFANLFWFYEGYKHFIPNAVEFCAFFYANISFSHYPDSVEILDSITCEVFLNSGVYPNWSLYYDEYVPTNDKMVKKAIDKWKEKGYGLR